MAPEISDLTTLRQFETEVPGPNGANRFITIVGLLRIPLVDSLAEHNYTRTVGPVLEPHEVLGVTFLPSIAAVDLKGAQPGEFSLKGFTAEYDADSGRVEMELDVSAAGSANSISIVFSLTILAAA